MSVAPAPAPAPAVLACIDRLASHFASRSLSPMDAAFVNERSTLRRYATARNGDFEAARKNLEETLAWRVAHVPAVLSCPACTANPLSHCFFTLGIDAQRRVVVYASAAKAKMNEKNVTLQHMCHTLEHAWRATQELDLAATWVWIIDFGGFSIWDAMQGSTSNGALSAFSNHMPERLGAAVLLNPPTVFDILLAAMRPFLDARTMSKVRIVRGGDTAAIQAQLAQVGIAPESGTSAWMGACLAMPPTAGSVPDDSLLDGAVLDKIRLLREPPKSPAGPK